MTKAALVVASVVFILGSTLVRAQSTPSLQLTMGNPSGAVASSSYPTNYLMQKNQYSHAYYRDRGIPIWVAWHLGSADLGDADRSSSFTTDTTLPSGWYRVSSSSYTNSGYDRGHMCPSADRTATDADNKATFVMTNVVPQTADLNQGPWAAMENYLRSLVSAGNELYVYTGPDDSKGTIDSGRVQIPAYTWKIVLVLPAGSSDVSRVTASTRVIAVDIPNNTGIRSANWKSYRTTVDKIEGWTGFNFFTALSTSIQSAIESKVDTL